MMELPVDGRARDPSCCDQLHGHEGGRKRGRLILMSDVYYHNENLPGRGNALERSLRAMIAHGGFWMVVASWKVRTSREADFLPRLRDLGTVLPTTRCGNGVYVGALVLRGAAVPDVSQVEPQGGLSGRAQML